MHEINLRFDTPDGSLTRDRRVLRLRQDAGAVMTYKGPAQAWIEVSSRQEIEFQVSDFGAARRLLEALGYEVSVMYEKYRTTYTLDDLVIVLDEMPFGSFVGDRGPRRGEHPRCCGEAGPGLGSPLRLPATWRYSVSFVQPRGIAAQNLSFANLKEFEVHLSDMGLRYADPGRRVGSLDQPASFFPSDAR